MKYKLIDSEGIEYEINNGSLVPSTARGSFTRTGDSYSLTREVIKRSFLPGSVVVGSVRLEAREMTFRATFATQTDKEFNDYINELMLWLNKAVILEEESDDDGTKRRANIAALKLKVNYDEGSSKRSGEVSIPLLLLDGYWTSATAVSVTQTISAGATNIALVNNGYLIVYPMITVTVAGLCPLLDLYIDETKEGLQLIDSTLGQASLEVLNIDCQKGTLRIADFDRSQNIVPRSGYFPIPIGDSTFVVETPVQLDIEIVYYERYYI